MGPESAHAHIIWRYYCAIYSTRVELGMASSDPDFEKLDVLDLSSWLEKQGIPQELCETFCGNCTVLYS